MATGGLAALQSMTLIAALPFTGIMLLLCYSLCRGLQADKAHSTRRLSPASDFWNGKHWRTRLDRLVRHTGPREALNFLEHTALPALHSVSGELNERGLNSRIEQADAQQCALVIPQEGRRDFYYGVRLESRPLPAFNPLAAAHSGDQNLRLYEAMTFFADGRAGYDIQYLTRDEISADVLRHYERYLSLIQSDSTELLNSAPEHSTPPQPTTE